MACTKEEGVVCHSQSKREWFVTGARFPEGIWAVTELDPETDAFELLYSSAAKGKTTIRQEPGSRWLSGRGAREATVRTQSVKVVEGGVLSAKLHEIAEAVW